MVKKNSAKESLRQNFAADDASEFGARVHRETRLRCFWPCCRAAGFRREVCRDEVTVIPRAWCYRSRRCPMQVMSDVSDFTTRRRAPAAQYRCPLGRLYYSHGNTWQGAPDVGGVVHAHPFPRRRLVGNRPTAGDVSSRVHSFRQRRTRIFGGNQINTEKDGHEVAEMLGQGAAILLKIMARSRSEKMAAQAVIRMYYLEQAAYAHLIAGKRLSFRGKPDSTYRHIIDDSYKFLWRTWHWEIGKRWRDGALAQARKGK